MKRRRRDFQRFARLLLPWLLVLAFSTGGCSGEAAVPIEGQTITVACGQCVFEMEGVEGCPWAAEIEGVRYLVQGAVPQQHQAHAVDGICSMERKAVVDGVIRGEILVVSRMELLPAEGVSEDAHEMHEHVH